MFAQWPLFVSYAVSFLVVGAYWVAHHTSFSFIREVDETQLWLNLLFLFCLSFIPFSAEILGEHPRFRTGVIIYGLNMAASSAALYWNWRYASRSGHILVKRLRPAGDWNVSTQNPAHHFRVSPRHRCRLVQPDCGVLRVHRRCGSFGGASGREQDHGALAPPSLRLAARVRRRLELQNVRMRIVAGAQWP